jgi:DNA mismatch endonuclease, patch repair protein
LHPPFERYTLFPQDGCLTRLFVVSRVGYHPLSHLKFGVTSMDTLSRKERSRRMALIPGKDTKPELLVRRIVRSCGYRFRLNVAELPGKPDLVFPSRKKVIFVHGCFWHRHPGCAMARLPKTKLRFWLRKLTENRQRDLRNIARLRRRNWGVSVAREQLRDPSPIRVKIDQHESKNH